MYVNNMSFTNGIALTARWSNAEPAYKADPASPAPAVSWRLSRCLLPSCINFPIHNKTLKVNLPFKQKYSN